jgi:hypothetical protein
MFNFRREDNGFTGRCGHIRMQNLRHNPYVGSFSHSNIKLTNLQNGNTAFDSNMLLGYNNPLIGTFRHSPSVTSSVSLGLKSFLWENPKAPYISQLQLAKETNQEKNLNKIFIQSLPFSHFSKENLSDIPQCVICLECFEDGDEFRTLNCHHCFHKLCIDNWLELKISCPFA